MGDDGGVGFGAVGCNKTKKMIVSQCHSIPALRL